MTEHPQTHLILWGPLSSPIQKKLTQGVLTWRKEHNLDDSVVWCSVLDLDTQAARTYTECRVILLISSEDNFFYDCVADNVNLPKFKLQWQEYVTILRKSLTFLQEHPDIYQQSLLLDANKLQNMNFTEVLSDVIGYISCGVLNKRNSYPCLKIEQSLSMISATYARTSKDVDQIRSQIRDGYEPRLIKLIREKVGEMLAAENISNSDDDLLASNAAIELNQTINDSTVWRDVRAICQRLFTTAQFYAGGRNTTCAAALIDVARIRIKRVDDQKQSDAASESIDERVVREIGEALGSCCRNFLFRHKVFAIDSFYLMLLELLQSPKREFAFIAMKLIGLLMDADFQQYGTKIAQLDKGKSFEQHITRILVDKIIQLQQPLLSLLPESPPEDDTQKQLREYADIICAQYFTCLQKLIRGSEYHASHITVKDVERFIDVADKTCESGYSLISSEIYSYFTQLLTYGTKDVALCILNSKKLKKQVINTAYQLLQEGHFHHLKFAIQFFDMFVIQLKKSQEEDVVDGEEGNNDYDPEQEEEGETTFANKDSMDITDSNETRPAKELSSEAYELVVTVNSLKHRRAKLESSSARSQTRILAQERKKLKIEEYQITIEELEHKVVQSNDEKLKLYEKINEVELINVSLQEKVSDLEKRLRQALEQQHSSQTEEAKVAFQHVLSTGRTGVTQADPILQITNPSEVIPQEAKRFITALRDERMNMTDMRDSLCGGLIHLGADLYSSQVHFLNEILQNIDDNRYAPDATPFAKIRFSMEHIIISYNELGFRPQDVLSICKLAVSTKTGGDMIGQKGLGWKSVFACTHNPIVVSGPWSFYFHYIPGQTDALAFITPHWIDQDSLPTALREEMKAGQAKTYLFLPLLPKLKNSLFLDSAIAAIDERILINLRNLKQLIIIDERNHEEMSMNCNIRSFQAGPDAITFESGDFKKIQEREIVLQVGNKGNTKGETFHVFECDVEVPIEVRESEPTRRNSKRKDTTLLLAFPSPPPSSLSTFPVYAFLPVCDVGLHFVINADWVLVTNRENIPGEKPWNQFLLKQLARFFLWLVLNRTQVRAHVGMYAPCTVPGMSASWVEFVSDVNALIAKYLPEKLLLHSGRPRLPEPTVCKLVNDEAFLQCGNVEIIRCDEKLQDVLRNAGVPVVSVKDILGCIGHPQFKAHAYSEQAKWWNEFFGLLSVELLTGSQDTVTIASSKPIFKVRGYTGRCALPSSDLLFTTDDVNMKMWRSNMYIIDADSSHELLFIQRAFIAQPLSSSELVHHILRIHLASTKPGTTEEVWHDLEYIMEHFQEYLEVVQTIEPGKGTCGSMLYIPVEEGFTLAEDITLPTLLSLPIPFHESSQKRVVPYHLPTEELFYLDILKWELFLLQLGCKLSLLATTNYRLPLLPPFTSYTPMTASLAHQILSALISRNDIHSTQLLNFLQSHPIRTVQGHDIAVSLVCENQRFRGILPCVDIPIHARQLASLLGVTMEPNLTLCLKSLHALVQQQVTSPKEYYEWLLDMRHYTHQMADYNVEDLKSLPILYLANPTTGFAFYALKDVYVCSDDSSLDAIELICQTMGKTIISKRHNDRFLFFADMLRNFGSQTFPSVKEVIACMVKLAKDRSIIHPSGATFSRLTNEGFLPFKQLYLLMERILVHLISGSKSECLPELTVEHENAIDWEKRRSVQSHFEEYMGSDDIKAAFSILPFISHDKQILTFHELDTNHVFAALHNTFVGTVDGSGSSRINFLEVSLARSCPYIIAAMGLRYLELNSVLKFVHSNITLERVAAGISRVLKDKFGMDVTALAVPWLNIELLVPSIGSARTSDENFEQKAEKLERHALREGPFFVLMNSLLVCATSRSPAEASRKWAATLAQLMQRTAAQSNEVLSNTDAVMRAQELLRGVDVRANVQWVGACGPPDFCNADSVIFPVTSETAITEDYFVNLDHSTKEDNMEEDTPQRKIFGAVSFERRALDEIFAERAKTPRSESARVASGNIRTEGVIVDEKVKEVQAEAALNAEHFFSRFLAHHYGDKFDPMSHWRSSLRRKVYRDSTMNSTIDDGCGYDFEVRDTIHLFDTPSNDKVQTRKRMCFFEVKGCAGPWRGEFHISENEVQRKERAQDNKDREAYVVVLVEYAVDPTKIQFVDMVVWSDLPSRINIRPNSYIATLAPTPAPQPVHAYSQQPARGRDRDQTRDQDKKGRDSAANEARGNYTEPSYKQHANKQQVNYQHQQQSYTSQAPARQQSHQRTHQPSHQTSHQAHQYQPYPHPQPSQYDQQSQMQQYQYHTQNYPPQQYPQNAYQQYQQNIPQQYQQNTSQQFQQMYNTQYYPTTQQYNQFYQYQQPPQ